MTSLRLIRVGAALLLAVNAPAWALNKCIGPSGTVVFQDAPCAGQGDPVTVKPANGQGDTPDSRPAAPAAPSAGARGGTDGTSANGVSPKPVTPLRQSASAVSHPY